MGCGVVKGTQGASPSVSRPHREHAHSDDCHKGKGAPELKPEDLNFSQLTRDRKAVSIPKTEDRGLFPVQLAELVEYLISNAEDVIHTSSEGAQWQVDGLLRGWSDKFTGKDNLKISEINLYQVAFWIIRPLTAPQAVSYVEAIAADSLSQRPKWFCSHWWGDPVLEFLRCIERHRTLRALPVETGYWVCAYANNQHKLDAEIVKDPAQTSFRKAMALSDGTVSVLDSGAVAFTRIWCCYEMAITLESAAEDKLYDIVTSLSDGRVVAFSQGVTVEDERLGQAPEWSYRGGGVAVKAAREKDFPLKLLARSLKTRLQDGQATVEVDRTRILNAIAGRPGPELELPPLAQSDCYEELNGTLRWRFAVAGCELVAEAGAEMGVEDLKDFTLDSFAEPGKGRVFPLYVEMAEAFQKQSKYDLARQFLEKAAAWKLKALGDDCGDLELAAVYERLGEVHVALNNGRQAREAYENALSMRSALQGESHLDVATLLLGYGTAHTCFIGERKRSPEELRQVDEEALKQFHRALDIRSQVLGAEHPDVGRAHIAIGTYWIGRFDESKSEGPLVQGREILERALGPDHVEVARASLLLANGLAIDVDQHYKRIVSELQRARRIFRASGEGNLLEAARATGTLGKVIAMQMQFPEAAVYLSQAERELSHILGEHHNDLGSVFGRLAVCYDRMRLYEEALEMFEKAGENFRRSLGPEHIKVKKTEGDAQKLRELLAQEEETQRQARREYYGEIFENEVKRVKEQENDEAV